VNLDLTAEAADFGQVARHAIEAAGGDELAARAEDDPAGRAELVEPVLARLGAWDLDPRSSPEELEAAAALCRSAGWWALPYPVAERLCRPLDLDVVGAVVVGEHDPSAAVLGLDGAWAAVHLDGRRSLAVPAVPAGPARRTAMVTPLHLVPAAGRADDVDLALGLVLGCWTLLGMLDRAVELTRTHVRQREQFGQPLARFQGVQFQLTDAELERTGADALARYALWSIEVRRPEVLDDALALRLGALESADAVFRIAHQLHGAIGFCDESPLSWLSRYSEPLRRLPLPLPATTDLLARRLGAAGLVGLFDGKSARR
jgi:hypothetical protein